MNSLTRNDDWNPNSEVLFKCLVCLQYLVLFALICQGVPIPGLRFGDGIMTRYSMGTQANYIMYPPHDQGIVSRSSLEQNAIPFVRPLSGPQAHPLRRS